MSNSRALTLIAPSPFNLAGPLVDAVRQVALAREERRFAARERKHIERVARELRRELQADGRETTARFVAVVQSLARVDPETRTVLLGVLRELLEQEDARRESRLGR